ncbi:MAG: heme lyase CcmF/NrfE family subunit [Gammaproteobacteria bacterium]|nr:heme lyase CcmF/NrfE family subunit [Gammaproteobacteria bacterium]
MIPEVGQFALSIALCLALVQSIVPLAGAQFGNAEWMAAARPAAQGQFLFVAIAFACLTYAFVTNDFTVAYVAGNSNSALPLPYRVSAVWGGHEGSLLLWALVLAGWTFAVTLFSRSLPPEFRARVIAVMGLVSIGFLLFMLATSNPFERLFPGPADGQDLNPLLQDPGLVIHPPMLYMGYVGMSVAFAFAIAALLGGHLDSAWARWSRPWVTVAWVFLTTGIMLGSWWAYHELGWGGWWFWDPVENASFMPWLVGTALMHSLAVTDKRGAFKNWTVMLAILAFSLSLLGTFLVRSGVLVSVHAFATDPARGIYILMFLLAVVGGSLLLYAWRAPKVRGGGGFDTVSRETALLINNILLVTAAATILLGTLYPLFLDAMGLGKISVGPPYFAAVFVPLMLPLVFLIGVGPLARWRQSRIGELAHRLRYVLLAGIGLGVLVPLIVAGTNTILVAVGIALAGWAAVSAGMNLFTHVRRQRAGKPWAQALASIPRAMYGMTVAHLGMGVFIVGITFASAFEVERQLSMAPGESTTLSGYEFTFQGVSEVAGPNYVAERGLVEVARDGEVVAILHPEKRVYRVQTNPMTDAAIDSTFTRDLYVALGEPTTDGGARGVRLYYKPFVQWLWLGPMMMAFGGVLAASDQRYRVSTQRETVRTEGLSAQPQPG